MTKQRRRDDEVDSSQKKEKKERIKSDWTEVIEISDSSWLFANSADIKPDLVRNLRGISEEIWSAKELHELGYQKYGNETMYSGHTGKIKIVPLSPYPETRRPWAPACFLPAKILSSCAMHHI